MKTEKFLVSDKGGIFSKANAMHDCSFTLSSEERALTLCFNNLGQYNDGPPITPWFGGYDKLTIHYRDIDGFGLYLQQGKRNKEYFNTVKPLENCELIMFKYSIDSFDAVILDFFVTQRKKHLNGKIEMYPKEIEYIWE